MVLIVDKVCFNLSKYMSVERHENDEILYMYCAREKRNSYVKFNLSSSDKIIDIDTVHQVRNHFM